MHGMYGYCKIKKDLKAGGICLFGYIRPQKGELLVREFEQYRGFYCGLCKQLGNAVVIAQAKCIPAFQLLRRFRLNLHGIGNITCDMAAAHRNRGKIQDGIAIDQGNIRAVITNVY